MASGGIFPANGDSPVDFYETPDVASTTTAVQAGGQLNKADFVQAASLRSATKTFTTSSTASVDTVVVHGLVDEAGNAIAPTATIVLVSGGEVTFYQAATTTDIYVKSTVASDVVTVLFLY